MRGLVRNNLYSMESSIALACVLSAFLAVSSLFLKSPMAAPLIIAVQVFLFVVNIGPSLRADEMSKWSKYEITLPVSRGTLVLAKYISIVILLILGVLMGAVTVLLSHISGHPMAASTLLRGFEHGLTLSFFSIAIMYPLVLKLGTERNELILILSSFGAIGMQLLIAASLSKWTGGMNMRHPLAEAVSTFAALITFVVSYFVSVKLHKSKEF